MMGSLEVRIFSNLSATSNIVGSYGALCQTAEFKFLGSSRKPWVWGRSHLQRANIPEGRATAEKALALDPAS